MRDKGVSVYVFLLIHRDIGSMQGTVCIGRFRIDFYHAKTGTDNTNQHHPSDILLRICC